MQITPTGTSGAVAAQGTQCGASALQSEDFFRILVTELEQQDPLKPADTASMIAQVSQIRSIELSKQLSEALSQIARQQRITGVSDLLGKYVVATVTAADGSEQEISGVVTGVRFDADGSPILELDTGQAVPAASVTRITSVETSELLSASGNQRDQNRQSASAERTAAQKSASTVDKARAPVSGRPDPERSDDLLPWLSLEGAFHL